MTATSRVVKVVCHPSLVAGFSLAGVEVEPSDDPARTLELLKRHAAEAKAGVVLVDERLLRAVPLELRQRLDRQGRPIFAPFPSPSWDEAAAAEEYVLEILRQAVGYRVRPR
ncbi:MAG: V-type ATP synthase subunit F [Myxococcota bacterium]